jgi:dTDP-4-dehydrorhamnose reductase
MMVKKILVTGGNGQLGNCIKALEHHYGGGHIYTYLSSADLDITNESNFKKVCDHYQPHYIVNCAAYTAVDKAETDSENAFAVNARAVGNIAAICSERNITLIHISTDFVFEGIISVPLTEEEETAPTSVYGESKLKGERLVKQKMQNYFILRTSWLYSEYQNNFLKTMLRLGAERDELSVVFDQVGTPTYAGDLAETIFCIIKSDSDKYGVYHYSNEGVASWYDFAFEIFRLSNIKIDLKPITSDYYPTPAKRPAYSVMSKAKIKNTFGIDIPHWTTSLEKCIKKINL